MHRPCRPHGAARRPAALVLGGVVMALTVTGCGGIGQPAPYDPQGIDGLVIPAVTLDADDYVAVIDNPWVSWEAGSTWTYDVTQGGSRVGSMQTVVLNGSTSIAGVAATGVRTDTTIDGEAETDTRFYAQDRAGNVWWVGEESADLRWRAGEDGAEAGLAMPARPRLGDGWVAYVVPQRPSPSVMVQAQSSELINTREAPTSHEADSATVNSYRIGVGLEGVDNRDAGWRAILVDHQPG